MNDEPIIELKGSNGKLELYSDFVRLDRSTIRGFLIHGLKGKKDIYFRSVTSIQIKKPGFAAGYIQFSITGGIESTGGIWDAPSDENTLTFFNNEGYDKALKVKEYIEKSFNKKEASNNSNVSEADEIKKLHSLMKNGIITKEEFETKKKKILGL